MRYYTEAELATMLAVKKITLRKWRVQGWGPKFVKFTEAKQAPVRYEHDAVMEFLASRTFSQTSGEHKRGPRILRTAQ